MFSCSDDSLSSDSEVLEIPFISRYRAGVYECTASNDIAVDTQTVELTVNCKSIVNINQHALHMHMQHTLGTKRLLKIIYLFTYLPIYLFYKQIFGLKKHKCIYNDVLFNYKSINQYLIFNEMSRNAK